MSGNAPTNGTSNIFVMTLTNDATLVWLWQTNFSLTIATNGDGAGTVTTTGKWYRAGSTATLTASRAAGSHLAGWTGDTNGCTVSNVTLLVPMTQARSITARFELDTPPLFTEDFDGDFPSGWEVGNTSTRSTASWGAVDSGFGGVTNSTGTRMGYCAGVGYAGTDATPTYQNRMASYMQRTVDLSGYSGATLNFQSLVAGIDAHFDYCRVLVNGTKVWEQTTADSAWVAVPINLNKYAGNAAVTIRFEFDSDGSLTRTGWFIDDINLTVVAGDAFDENNATPINNLNTDVTDPPISETGGLSTFLVILRQGYSYTITVTPGTLKDPQVSLFDTNRILLAHNDDASGMGLGSRIHFVSYEKAGYFIQVGAYGKGTGTFTLRVDEAVPQADVAATAVSVAFSGTDPRGQNPDTLTYSIHNYGPMGLDNGETNSYRMDVYLSTSKTTAGSGVRIGSETFTLDTPSGGDSADLSPLLLSNFTVTNSLAAGTYYAWLHIVPLSGSPADPKSANNWVVNATEPVNVPPPEHVAISGRVTKPGGVTGVGDVTINALNPDGSLTNTTTTAANGTYSLIVPGGWTGRLMPTNSVLGAFTKPFISLVNVVAAKPSQNFVWKPAPKISGRVLRSGTSTGVQGVAITFSTVGVVTTGIGGVYSQSVPSGWSGTATATNTNGRFSAASRTYRTVTADKTLQNYTWIAPAVVPHATVVTQAAPAAQVLVLPSAVLMRSRGTVRWTGSDAAQLRALGGEVAIRLVAGAGTVCLPVPVSAPGDADWALSIEAGAVEFLGAPDAELVDIDLANGHATARAPRYGTNVSGPVNLQDDGDTIVLNWDLALTR